MPYTITAAHAGPVAHHAAQTLAGGFAVVAFIILAAVLPMLAAVLMTRGDDR